MTRKKNYSLKKIIEKGKRLSGRRNKAGFINKTRITPNTEPNKKETQEIVNATLMITIAKNQISAKKNLIVLKKLLKIDTMKFSFFGRSDNSISFNSLHVFFTSIILYRF